MDDSNNDKLEGIDDLDPSDDPIDDNKSLDATDSDETELTDKPTDLDGDQGRQGKCNSSSVRQRFLLLCV